MSTTVRIEISGGRTEIVMPADRFFEVSGMNRQLEEFAAARPNSEITPLQAHCYLRGELDTPKPPSDNPDNPGFHRLVSAIEDLLI